MRVDPLPVSTLATETVYDKSDQSRTETDPESEAGYLKKVAPIREFSQTAAKLGNEFARAKQLPMEKPLKSSHLLAWL